jgi:hypothetical protein
LDQALRRLQYQAAGRALSALFQWSSSNGVKAGFTREFQVSSCMLQVSSFELHVTSCMLHVASCMFYVSSYMFDFTEKTTNTIIADLIRNPLDIVSM